MNKDTPVQLKWQEQVARELAFVVSLPGSVPLSVPEILGGDGRAFLPFF